LSVISELCRKGSVWLGQTAGPKIARPARAHKKMCYIFGILPRVNQFKEALNLLRAHILSRLSQ
jgi:hypothetical protein